MEPEDKEFRGFRRDFYIIGAMQAIASLAVEREGQRDLGSHSNRMYIAELAVCLADACMAEADKCKK